MLQCVAVCFTVRWSVLHGVMQYVAVCCSVLQCVAVCCSVLQCMAVQNEAPVAANPTICRILQCVAVRYSVLQCVAARNRAPIAVDFAVLSYIYKGSIRSVFGVA